jgi:hypothetical protein
MDIEDFQQPELAYIRSAVELSFNSNQSSIIDMESEDFYELCKARLKVSKRNAALLLKLK